MAERIFAASMLGAFMLAVGVVGVDQLVFKPEAKTLAQGLAAKSMVTNSPDTQAKLASDLINYRGRDNLMQHMQNAHDFKIAADFGMTFWRLKDVKDKPTVDLGTSRARRIFDVTKSFLTAKAVNTAAVIDNRDPERGPVFIHDGLEQSHFDAAMEFLKKEYGTVANMPQSLIVVVYYHHDVGIIIDTDGEALKKSPYAPYIEESPWNPNLANNNNKGMLKKGREVIEKGLDFLGRSPK